MSDKRNSKLRSILAFTLAAILTACITFGAVYATNVTGGECGNGVSWSFTEDGTLTVSGNGMMNNYRHDTMPWLHLKNEVKRLVIEEGVTHVGEQSFYGFAGITELVLPEGLVSIGQYAFFGCGGIGSVTVPESVASIGQFAFRKTSLTAAVMSTDGWSAGGNALVGLDSASEAAKMLTSHAEGYMLYKLNWRRTVVAEVVTVASGDCGKNLNWRLTSDGIMVISGSGDMKNYGAFNAPWEAYKNVISKVVIENGVTSVGRCAFYGCYELARVTLSESLTTINEYAFYDCRSLGEVTVPKAVTVIGQYAFRKCFAMGSVILADPEGWYAGSDKFDGALMADGAYVWTQLSSQDYKRAWKSVCVHDYVEAVKVAATTFGEGLASYTCSKCGDAYDEVIPATKSLKLLAIGNSFSEDAFKHLYIVCKDAGIEELVLGNLYIGGCYLEKHYTQMVNDTAAYIFWISDDETQGMVKYDDGNKTTAKFGIEYTDWDYITLQQSSPNSGLPDTYDYLDDVISYVDQYKPADAKYFWHMTWAYQGNSTHSGFGSYGNDQMTMYNAILSCVNDKVLTNGDISGVIPSGTAIQNLRTSHLGDTLTRDGYHLSYSIGRYAAALTYLAAITGYDVSAISATPSDDVATHLPCIKEGVKNAIATPYAVTSSVDYPYVAPEEPETPDEPESSDGILGTTLSPLTKADREYLISKGYDPDRYMLLDLDVTYNAYYDTSKRNDGKLHSPSSGSTYKKFLGTQAFSRNELVVGALIRIDAGYKYRPEGWNSAYINGSANRPAIVYSADSELFTVTDEWWGDYEYRGFNICKGTTSSNQDITLEEKDNFKIYIPVATKSHLTAEDAEYLAGLGLNPNKYMVLDYTYTMSAYYNANASSGSNISVGTTTLHKQFLATNEKYTRYDIPVGSVIRITDGNYRYRAEGWVTLNAKVASDDRPVRVETLNTVVDAAWWGDWGYRAFNVQTKNSKVMTEDGATALRIYVPVEYSTLTAEDRAYLEGLGLNPDEYMVLNYDYTLGAHYNSSKDSNLVQENTAFVKRFAATEIFTRDDITVGSVIRLTKTGYQYRPDAWTSLDKKTNPRPSNVSAESVIVDEEWWGEYNYCGINVSRTTDTNAVTDEDVAVLRIYVKIN